MTSPPETLVQIQNNFNRNVPYDALLMMPSTKIAQMVWVCQTKGPTEP